MIVESSDKTSIVDAHHICAKDSSDNLLLQTACYRKLVLGVLECCYVRKKINFRLPNLFGLEFILPR